MAVSSRPSLIELREKLGHSEGKVECREFLKCQTIPGGVPRGVICEITGTARTEWVLSILHENPEVVTFWVEDKLSIFPTAIHQRGINLSQILMAEAADRVFQTLRKALR